METDPHGDDAFTGFTFRDLAPLTSSLASSELSKIESLLICLCLAAVRTVYNCTTSLLSGLKTKETDMV